MYQRGRQVPGAGQEIVEDRYRVLLERHRLAAEEVPPEGIARVPHVDRADMRELVVISVKKRSPGEKVSIDSDRGATSSRTMLLGDPSAAALP